VVLARKHKTFLRKGRLFFPFSFFQKQQPQTPDIPQTAIKGKRKKEKIIIIFRFSKNSPQTL
jgi:hypothetical protein